MDLTVKSRPPEDPSDWERAMTLADDLSRSSHIGDRQAKVYAAVKLDIPRGKITDRLDLSETNYYSTRYAAEDNIEDAQHIVQMLADHPALAEPQTVRDVPSDEFNPERDGFASDVRHSDSENLTDETFIDDTGHIVTVKQPLGPRTGDGIAGYLVQSISPSTMGVTRRAVAAERLDDLREDGTLQPATVSVEPDSE